MEDVQGEDESPKLSPHLNSSSHAYDFQEISHEEAEGIQPDVMLQPVPFETPLAKDPVNHLQTMQPFATSSTPSSLPPGGPAFGPGSPGGAVDTTLAAVKIQTCWRRHAAQLDVKKVKAQCATSPRQFHHSFQFWKKKKLLFRIRDLSSEIAMTHSYRLLPTNPYFFSLLRRHHLPKELHLSSKKRVILWHFLRWQTLGIAVVIVLLLCTVPLWTLLPTWAVLVINVLYNENDGKLEYQQVVSWALIYFIILTGILGIVSIVLTVIQEKFGRRMQNHITLICAKYSKLINCQEMELLRQYDVANVKVILFKHAPTIFTAAVTGLLNLVLVWLTHWQLGLLATCHLLVLGLYSMLYERFVVNHMKAVQKIAKEEVQNWSALAPNDHPEATVRNTMAVDRAFALNHVMMRTNLRSAFIHVMAGIVHRLLMTMGCAGFFLLDFSLTQDYHLEISDFMYGVFYYFTCWICVLICYSSLLGSLERRLSWYRLMEIAWQAKYLPMEMIQTSAYFDSLLDPNMAEHDHDQFELARRNVDIKASLNEEQYGISRPKQHLSKALAALSFLLIVAAAVFSLVFLLSNDISLQCENIEAQCAAASPGTDPIVTHSLSLQQEFSLREGCHISAPLRRVLNICGFLIWSREGSVRRLFLAPTNAAEDGSLLGDETLTIRFQYFSWRNQLRGVSANYKNSTEIGRLCPAGDPILHYHDQELVWSSSLRTLIDPVWGQFLDESTCSLS